MSTEHAITLLVLNGAIVFFVGMIVGFPYGAVRVRGGDAETASNWRISHTQNLQNGLLLLVIGACAPYVTLSTLELQAMVYLLVTAAWCDMLAWLIRPLTGHEGLLPAPPAANFAVFALFGITVLGQLIGIALLIYGAAVRWAGAA